METNVDDQVRGLVERLENERPTNMIAVLSLHLEAANAIEAFSESLASERAAHAETKRERDEAHDREISAVIGETEATKRAEAYRAQRDEALRVLDEIIENDRAELKILEYGRTYTQEHDGPFAKIARRALGGKKNG